MHIDKYVCDHCGKPLDAEVDCIGLKTEDGIFGEFDLCVNCITELGHLILEFLNKEDNT